MPAFDPFKSGLATEDSAAFDPFASGLADESPPAAPSGEAPIDFLGDQFETWMNRSLERNAASRRPSGNLVPVPDQQRDFQPPVAGAPSREPWPPVPGAGVLSPTEVAVQAQQPIGPLGVKEFDMFHSGALPPEHPNIPARIAQSAVSSYGNFAGSALRFMARIGMPGGNASAPVEDMTGIRQNLMSTADEIDREFASKEKFWADRSNRKNDDNFLINTLGQAGHMIPTLASGGLLAAPVTGLTLAGETRKEAIGLGASPEDADVSGIIPGLVGMGSEKLLGAPTRLLKGGLGGKTIERAMASSGAKEGVQEILEEGSKNIVINRMGIDPTRSPTKNLKEAGAAGLFLGALMGGGGHAASNIKPPAMPGVLPTNKASDDVMPRQTGGAAENALRANLIARMRNEGMENVAGAPNPIDLFVTPQQQAEVMAAFDARDAAKVQFEAELAKEADKAKADFDEGMAIGDARENVKKAQAEFEAAMAEQTAKEKAEFDAAMAEGTAQENEVAVLAAGKNASAKLAQMDEQEGLDQEGQTAKKLLDAQLALEPSPTVVANIENLLGMELLKFATADKSLAEDPSQERVPNPMTARQKKRRVTVLERKEQRGTITENEKVTLADLKAGRDVQPATPNPKPATTVIPETISGTPETISETPEAAKAAKAAKAAPKAPKAPKAQTEPEPTVKAAPETEKKSSQAQPAKSAQAKSPEEEATAKARIDFLEALAKSAQAKSPEEAAAKARIDYLKALDKAAEAKSPKEAAAKARIDYLEASAKSEQAFAAAKARIDSLKAADESQAPSEPDDLSGETKKKKRKRAKIGHDEKRRPDTLSERVMAGVGKIKSALFIKDNPNWVVHPIVKKNNIDDVHGQDADTALDAAIEMGLVLPTTTLTEFGEMLNNSAEAGKGEVKQAAKEKRLIKGEEKQRNAFDKAQDDPALSDDYDLTDAEVGDEMTMKGEPVKVSKVEKDASGAVTSVTLDDGKVLGTQKVHVVQGKTVSADKDSIDSADPDWDVDDDNDLSLDIESVQDQKKRKAAEAHEATKKKRREAIADKAAKPLTGDPNKQESVDQGKFFEEDEDLFTPPKKESAADRLRRIKADTDGKLFDATSGLLITAWNGAVEAAALTLEAGGKTIDAVNAAIKWLKANNKGKFDERKVRRAITKELRKAEVAKKSDRGMWDTAGPPIQEIESGDTSNAIVPSTNASEDFKPVKGGINADIGGGRWELFTQALGERGVINLIFDPFNRSQKHNKETASKIRDHQADTATANNVLNVIAEESAREGVIKQAANAIKPEGEAYFLIHQGSTSKDKDGNIIKKEGDGIGRKTTKGWQNYRKAETYMDEVRKHFKNVRRSGKLIIANNKKSAADKVRSVKVDTKGKMFDATAGLTITIFNLGVEAVALALEAGATVGDAIKKGIAAIRAAHPDQNIDEKAFTEELNKRIEFEKQRTSKEIAAEPLTGKVHWIDKQAEENIKNKKKGITAYQRLRENVEFIMDGLDVSDPKSVKEAFIKIARATQDLGLMPIDTIGTFMRRIGRRNKGKADAIDEMIDSLQPISGDGKQQGLGSLPTIDMMTGVMVNRYHKIRREFAEGILEKETAARQAEMRDEIGRLVTDQTAPLPNGTTGRFAKAVRVLNRQILEWMQSKGLDVSNAGEAHLTRQLSNGKLLEDPAGFREQVSKLFNFMNDGFNASDKKTDEEVAESVDYFVKKWEWMAKGYDPSVNPMQSNSAAEANSADFTKSRKFPKEADQFLNDFYERDIDAVMANYINNAVAQTVLWDFYSGVDPESGKIEKGTGNKKKIVHYGKVKQWRKRLAEDGVSKRDADQLMELFKLGITGFRGSDILGKAVTSVGTAMTIFSFMQYAPLSSIAEGLLVGAGTGSITKGVRAAGINLKRTITDYWNNGTDDDMRRFSEVLGSVQGKLLNIADSSMRMADTDLLGKKGNTLVDWFMRGTGLTSITNAARDAGNFINKQWMAEVGRNILGTEKRGVFKKKDGASDFDIERLIEVDIPASRHIEFAKFMAKGEGILANEDVDLTDPDSMNSLVFRALQKMSRESSPRPNNATRAMRAVKTPLGGLLYGLSSFQFDYGGAIQRAMNKRFGRFARSLKKGEKTRWDLMGAHAMLPFIVMLLAVTEEIRALLFGDSRIIEGRKGESLGKKGVRAASRAALLGRLDVYVNAFSGIKYQRDPATVLSGPLLGRLSQLFSMSATQYQDTVSGTAGNTNTNERRLGREALNVTVRPGTGLAGAAIHNAFSNSKPGRLLGTAMIALGGHPRLREFAVNKAFGKADAPGSSGTPSERRRAKMEARRAAFEGKRGNR